MKIIVLLTCFVLLSSQMENWEKTIEKDGITVFTKSIEGSNFKAFTGITEINSGVNELVNAIMDVEKYPEWAYKTLNTKLIKKDSNECYFYYLSETPPFVKSREAYYYYKIIKEKTGIVKITMNTYESNIPVLDNVIRIPVVDGSWELTPINAHKTKVVFQMHAEPGGAIPAWLANLAITDSPIVTLKNLRALLTKNN